SEHNEREGEADIEETQHDRTLRLPSDVYVRRPISGTPRAARSRACAGGSVRTAARKCAERALGFDLVSPSLGIRGRRLTRWKLGAPAVDFCSGRWREPFGASRLRLARKRLAMRSSSEWKVTTTRRPPAFKRSSAALKPRASSASSSFT